MATLGEPIAISAVTSWGNASTDMVGQLVARNKWNGIVYNADGSTWDATGLADTSMRHGTSLKSLSFTLEAHMGTPIDGYSGAVTFASGDVLNVNEWNMTISRRMGDITPFGASWRTYSVGRYKWSGGFSGFLDDTTAPAGVLIATTPAAATFTVLSGGTGKQLSGNISVSASKGDLKTGADATKAYTFEGDNGLTTVGSSTAALWAADAGGATLGVTTLKALVLTLASGITLSGNAQWESIKVSCKVGESIKVSVTGKFSGTVTGFSA